MLAGVDVSLGAALRDVMLVTLVVVGARLLWLNTVPYLVKALDRRPAQRARWVGARQRFPVAWAGFRGAVSLAAALALPEDMVGRDRVVLVTFGVIVVTLAVQGLTMPAVVRWAQQAEDRLRLALLGDQRAAAVRLRDTRRIDDTVLRRVQTRLDAEEIRLSEPAAEG